MLSHIDEIWMVENIFDGTEFGGTYLRFVRYQDGHLMGSLDFKDGILISRL